MAQSPSYYGVMYKHSELTEAFIGAIFSVYGALGYGFLEKVYANALKLELEKRGRQQPEEMVAGRTDKSIDPAFICVHTCTTLRLPRRSSAGLVQCRSLRPKLCQS